MSEPLVCQRDAFQLAREDHYFNCAYMGPLPRVAEEAGFAAIQRKAVPTRITPPDSFWDTDALRELYARLIRADDPTRVAIQPGVSYAVATAAKNLPLSSGQNIVLTHEQFPGNVYSWHRLAGESGAQLRAVDPGEGADRGRRWNERLLESIDSSTGIVSVPNVHWTDGTLFDLEAIGRPVPGGWCGAGRGRDPVGRGPPVRCGRSSAGRRRMRDLQMAPRALFPGADLVLGAIRGWGSDRRDVDRP